MYGIALSVAACLRAGTRVDIAWIAEADPPLAASPDEAVAFTPGGGRLGSMLSGALDGPLGELAAVQAAAGRVVDVEVGVTDAVLAGLDPGLRARVVLAPGDTLPEDTWDLLARREPLCLVSHLDGDTITHTDLYTRDTIAAAGEEVARIFDRGAGQVAVTDQAVITALWPVPTLVIAGGGGPMAEALEHQAALMGWHPTTTRSAADAEGLIATLAALDSVVVMGHDLEITGRALMAALAGAAGYIGSVGPRDLRRAREDWLAYRGVSDLDRIHGPAGLDIGARSPQEIAVSIVAEIIATHAS